MSSFTHAPMLAPTHTHLNQLLNEFCCHLLGSAFVCVYVCVYVCVCARVYVSVHGEGGGGDVCVCVLTHRKYYIFTLMHKP
jgi:hypothetical protein